MDSQSDSKPVVAASVSIGTAARVAGASSLLLDIELGESGTTDAGGAVSFELPEVLQGRVAYVQVEATGFASAIRVLDRAKADAEIRLVLQPGERLSGVVVTPSGGPVPGVRVSARLFGYPRCINRRLPSALPGRFSVVMTDAQGRFEFPSLVHGMHEVGVDDPNWTLWVKKRQRGEPPESVATLFGSGTSDDIRLIVERLAFFRVRFVDAATGRGVPTADEVFATGVTPVMGFRNVELGRLPGPLQGMGLGLQATDPSTWVGCVAVEGPEIPETAELAFAVPGYTYGATRVHLHTADQTRRLQVADELRMDSLGEDHGIVDLRVIVPPGIVLGEGVQFLQAHLSNGIYMNIAGSPIGKNQWRFEHVPTTAKEVAFLRFWETSVPVIVRAGQRCDVVIDLAAMSGITVAVQGADGEPMFGVNLYVRGKDRRFKMTAPPDRTGFHVTPQGETRRAPLALKPGRYEVKAWLLGHRLAKKTVTVEPGHLEHVVLTLERSW